MTSQERDARQAAHEALIDAWHQYLATLPLEERLERLTH